MSKINVFIYLLFFFMDIIDFGILENWISYLLFDDN